MSHLPGFTRQRDRACRVLFAFALLAIAGVSSAFGQEATEQPAAPVQAEEPLPEGPGVAEVENKVKAFPLAYTETKLSPDVLEETLAEARENDVDVTVPNALLYKGLMLFQDDEFDECIPFLEEALRRNPAMTAGWEALGWAYYKTDKPARARALWDYFQSLMPDHWMPYNLLAQQAIMDQDWKKADEMLRACLRRNPELFDQRYWYGQNLMRLGRPAEGEKVFRRLIAREPGRLDVQIDLANILTFRFAYDEAVQIWRFINDELPGNPTMMMNQAELEFRLGERKTAERLCEEVLEIDPTNQRALTLRIDVADSLDSSVESIDLLHDLIDSIDDDKVFRSELWMRLARRCVAINHRDPGRFSDRYILDVISKAIDDNPLNLEAITVYAEKCVLAKRYRSAHRWAKYILENFNANSIRAKDVLLEVALAERRYDDAEQIIVDRYRLSDPMDPLRLRQMARVQMGRGDFQEAIRNLDILEASASRGSVLTLLYHGLTESDWMSQTSVRRLREHLNALQNAGFILIPTTNIVDHVSLKPGENQTVGMEDLQNEERPPFLARAFDWLFWNLTGTRHFKDRPAVTNEVPMKKYFNVTFDGGLQSSFILGEKVASDFGVPFMMFVNTEPRKEYVPELMGWGDIRRYVTNGHWTVGSALYKSDKLVPADEEGKDLRRPLPNRVWMPKRGRLESMNEWDERMRFEFRESRRVVAKEMGKMDSTVPMVAYPFGDVGQDSACNLSSLRNPIPSITTEASRSYKVGFVQNACGYTSVGDNLLMARRLEPAWNDEGDDVVRKAFEMHPVFMARRTRIELAMHMNRPHMAEDMIQRMRNDGYPDDLLRDIEREVKRHFRGMPNLQDVPLVTQTKSDVAKDQEEIAPLPPFDTFDDSLDPDAQEAADKAQDAAESTPREEVRGSTAEVEKIASMQDADEADLIHLTEPFVSGNYSHTKAVDQFELTRLGVEGGWKLNTESSLTFSLGMMDIDQRFRALWNNVTNDNTQVDYHSFDATLTDARARYSHRMNNGAVISLSFGFIDLKLDYDPEETQDLEDEVGMGIFDEDKDGLIPVYGASVDWSTRNDLRLRLFYLHDVLPVAAKAIKYDSFGGKFNWEPADRWKLGTKAQYWSYSDDNALFNIEGETYYEMLAEMGVWLGAEGVVWTSSHACDYYWTPYWDEHVCGVLRYVRELHGYYFRLDFLMGVQREDARPLRRKQDNGLSGASDWGYIWGVRSKCDYTLYDNFDIGLEVSIMALREYIDHSLLLKGTLRF